MTLERLISSLAFVVLVLVGFPALGQQAPPEAPARDAVSSERAPFLWPGAGPLWFGFHPAGRELTVEEVTLGLQRWIASSGNPRLKAGKVTEKDARTITAEVVTVDDSLVRKFDIDRRTGMVWQMQRSDGWGAWQHWGSPGWMGGSWQGRSGWMPFPFIGMFVFMIVMVVGALIFVIVIGRGTRPPGWWSGASPIDELNARYAGGEISRDEYLHGKSSLRAQARQGA